MFRCLIFHKWSFCSSSDIVREWWKGCPTPFETHSIMLVPFTILRKAVGSLLKSEVLLGVLDPFRQILCWVSEIRKAWRVWVPSFLSWEVWLEPSEGLVLWHHPGPPLHLEPVLPRKLNEWKPTIEVGWKDEEILFKKGENLRFQWFLFPYPENPAILIQWKHASYLVEIFYFGPVLHWTNRVSRFQLKMFPRSFQDVPGTKFLAPIFDGMSTRQHFLSSLGFFWEMIQIFDLWKVGKGGGTNHCSADSKTPRGHPNWESSTKVSHALVGAPSFQPWNYCQQTLFPEKQSPYTLANDMSIRFPVLFDVSMLPYTVPFKWTPPSPPDISNRMEGDQLPTPQLEKHRFFTGFKNSSLLWSLNRGIPRLPKDVSCICRSCSFLWGRRATIGDGDCDVPWFGTGFVC